MAADTFALHGSERVVGRAMAWVDSRQPDALLLQGLRPAKRGFLSRLSDAATRSFRGIGSQRLNLASKLVDARLRPSSMPQTEPGRSDAHPPRAAGKSPSVRDHVVLAQFARDVVGAIKSHGADADRLFSSVSTRLTLDQIGRAAVFLGQFQRSEIIEALAQAWSKDHKLSPKLAQQKAEVVYAALVARAIPYGQVQREQARSQAGLDAIWDSVLNVVQDSPRAGLAVLKDFEAHLKAQAQLDYSSRAAFTARIAEQRASLHLDRATLETRCEALRESLPLDRVQLDARLKDLERLAEHAEISEALAPGERVAVQDLLLQARADLHTLLAREADLAQMESEELGGIAGHLRSLDAPRYLEVRGDLDHVLASADAADRPALLQAINARMKGASAQEIAAEISLIQDLRAGDKGVLNMVLPGAQWDDAVYRLRRQALEQQHEARTAQIAQVHGESGQHPRSEAHEAALAQADRIHQQALTGLDLDHQWRQFSRQLDQLMQAFKAAGKDPGNLLPANAFTALMPSATLMVWLARNSSGFVSECDVVIANWMRLALSDKATGVVDEVPLKPLLEALGTSLPQRAKDIEALVRQGFSSTDEIQACARQVAAFARKLRASGQSLEALEAHGPHLRAQRIVPHLVASLTASGAPVVDDAGVSAQEARRQREQVVAAWVGRKMPFIEHQVRESELRRRHAALSAALGRCLPQALKDSGAGKLHERAALALQAHERMKSVDVATLGAAGVTAAEAARKERDEHLGALGGLDLTTLASKRKSLLAGTSPAPSIERLLERQADLELLAQRRQLEAQLRDIAAKATLTGDWSGEVDALIDLALLEEAANRPEGLAAGPEVADAVGNALVRMGLHTNGSAFAKQVVSATRHNLRHAIDLDGALGRHDPRTAVNMAKAGAKAAAGAVLGLPRRTLQAAGGATAPAGGAATAPAPASSATAPVVDPQERARQHLATQLSDKLAALERDSEFDLSFGPYGEVTLGQARLPGAKFESRLRVGRQEGVTVRCEADGSYTVHVYKGSSVRKGVSFAFLGDALSLSGYGQADRRGGFAFSFADRDGAHQCLQALCRAELPDLAGLRPDDPSGFLAQARSVAATASRGSQGGVQAKASLGLKVADLVAQAELSAGTTRTVRTTGQGQVEVLERQGAVQASAQASLVADQGSRQVAAGMDLRVRRELHSQFGMWTPASTVSISRAVIGGNVAACVDSLLPDLAPQERAQWVARVGEVEDGTVLHLQGQMRESVVHEANQMLGQAQQLLRRSASVPAGHEQQALQAQAQALVEEAYALSRRPESYLFTGLGWTTSTRDEAQASRGVYTQAAQFATGTTRFQAFAPGQAPAHLGRVGQWMMAHAG